MDDSEAPPIVLTEREALIAANALDEVVNNLDVIEDWEFDTRIGAPRSEASELLRRLGREIRARWRPET